MKKGRFNNVCKHMRRATDHIKADGKESLLSIAFWANVVLAALNVGCLLAYEPACQLITPLKTVAGV